MAGVTAVERWDMILHNFGTRTGLKLNGSSIKKNKRNKHTYNLMLQVKLMKLIVLFRLQQAAIKTGVSYGRINILKRRDKMKFPTFTMDLRRLST